MRRALVFFLLLASLCGNPIRAHAQRSLNIAVISPAGDARLRPVDDVISFWNKMLQEVGTCLRFGPVTHLIQPIPEEALESLSRSILAAPRGPIAIPPALRDPPGDVTIFLGMSDFISFTGPRDSNSRRVIGIKGLEFPPLNMPNVARNVIAQALGFAIGLPHNSNPRTLMCGRPAPCRPNIFRSNIPHVFPLADAERDRLRRMYPACIAKRLGDVGQDA
jgi:hypothetical protein